VTTARATALRFLASFASIFFLSSLWAVAVPVFSVPDEVAHATKGIAQARGQIVGEEIPGTRHIVVDLPEGYEYDGRILCYATVEELSASCAVPLGAEGGAEWFNTWVGAYNPVYYALVSWPSLVLSGNEGVIAMRVASALVNSLLMAAAIVVALGAARRTWMPWAVSFLAAPMVVYFAGAVNPQGFEFAGAALLWVGGLRLLQSWSDDNDVALRRTTLWAAVAIGALVVSNARATGPLWVLIIAGLCALAVGWPSLRGMLLDRTSIPWLAAVAVPAIFSVAWTLLGGSLSNQAEENDAPLVGGSVLQGAWFMIRTTPAFIQQAVGYFGWFDAPLPSFIYPVFYIAVAVPVLVALAALRRRSRLVVVAVVASSLLVPVAVQAYSVSQTGIIWQGRYGIFLFLGVVLVSAWLLDRQDGDGMRVLAARLSSVLAGGALAVGAAAFVFVLRRYTIGLDRPITTMLTEVEWQPPLGWVALTALYLLVTVGAYLGLVLESRRAIRDAPPVPPATLTMSGDDREVVRP